MANQTINRSGRSHNYTLPAPTGGLNVRDGLDTMSETDAIVMDNYYPSGNESLSARRVSGVCPERRQSQG